MPPETTSGALTWWSPPWPPPARLLSTCTPSSWPCARRKPSAPRSDTKYRRHPDQASLVILSERKWSEAERARVEGPLRCSSRRRNRKAFFQKSQLMLWLVQTSSKGAGHASAVGVLRFALIACSDSRSLRMTFYFLSFKYPSTQSFTV